MYYGEPFRWPLSVDLRFDKDGGRGLGGGGGGEGFILGKLGLLKKRRKREKMETMASGKIHFCLTVCGLKT